MKKNKIVENKISDRNLHSSEGQTNGFGKHHYVKSYSAQLCEKNVEKIQKIQDSSYRSVNWKKITRKEDSPRSYICNICTNEFSSKHRLRNHERASHGMHQFICIFCKEGFLLKKHLITHVLVHKGIHGYKCEICFKVRPNYIMILRHLKTHAAKNIPCMHCGACFKTRWELKSHEIQHKKDRQFNCKLCGSTFINSSQLRCHMNAHCMENSYKCEICGKNFNTLGYLTNHKKFHFDEKPFKCQYCNLCFLTNSARKKHAEVHTTERRKQFICEECGKEYSSTTSLAVHKIKIHSESETFQCQYCKNKFKTKALIIAHGKEHAVERPHSCKQCLCRYKNKRELKRHQREKSHFDGEDVAKEIPASRNENNGTILAHTEPKCSAGENHEGAMYESNKIVDEMKNTLVA